MLSQKINIVKLRLQENKSDIIIAVSFLLIALIAFGLGRLSIIFQNKQGVTIGHAQLGALADPQNTSAAVYAASKSGRAYYLSSCAGVSRIKEENKVWFSSKKEAEDLGYQPARNCPGL